LRLQRTLGGEDIVDEKMPKTVECGSHGQKDAAYLCQHLVRGSHLGFCVPAPTPDQEPSLEAWCNRCDRALQARGWVWDDISEENLGLTLVCSECFERSRHKNEAETRTELSDPL
jgi:hypothetical protein